MQPTYEVSTMYFGDEEAAQEHNTLVARVYDHRLSLTVDLFAQLTRTAAVIAIAAQHYEEYWLQYHGDVRGEIAYELERQLHKAAFG
jgi:hypothetical protein